MNNELCDICGKKKTSAVTGSFTQWLFVCRCDRVDGQKQIPLICMNCGKPQSKPTTGSFTQWVLRSASCQCENPKFATSPLSEIKLDIDQGLKFDGVTFPLDRYKPIRKLGMGGVGSVYLARDTKLEKLVAVKLLRVGTDEQLVGFQTEAKVTAKLKHPGIVAILDFGITQNATPYMVLEYVEGISLDHLLEEHKRLDEESAKMISIQITNALAHAHDLGIFHRDIKASNILIQTDAQGRLQARLIDFGIAFFNAGAQQTFQGRTLVGTPLYMSADQMQGRRFDERSEIYSVGCLMYELLTGALPFRADDPLALLELHARATVPPFSATNPGNQISTRFENIVRKCLEKEPESRYASMSELEEAIVETSGRQPVRPPSVRFVETEQKRDYKAYVFAAAIILALVTVGSYVWLLSPMAVQTLSSPQAETFLATIGSDEARVRLGERYYNGKGVTKNRQKSVEYFSAAAKHGPASAQYWLGICLLNGVHQISTSEIENQNQAFRLISTAADRGYPPAQRYMGMFNYLGLLCSKNLSEGLRWFKTAADNGDSEAQNIYAVYVFNSPNPVNNENNIEDRCFNLFKRASEAGYADAALNLGLCYEKGVGTKKDLQAAKKWYHEAAKKGIKCAQFRYGYLLEAEGNKRATPFYMRAATKDYPDAEFALSRCYAKGFGIERDLNQANSWFKKASEEAKTTREFLNPPPQTVSEKMAVCATFCKEHLYHPQFEQKNWGNGKLCYESFGMVTAPDLPQLATMTNGPSSVNLPSTAKQVALDARKFSKDDLFAVSKMPDLELLILNYFSGSDGLQLLNNCKKLDSVEITGDITQTVIKDIADIKSLSDVTIGDRDRKGLERVDLSPLRSMPRLRKLFVRNVTIDRHMIDQLKEFNYLECISINSFSTDVRDSDLKMIEELKCQRLLLAIYSNQITDAGYEFLAGLPNVAFIDISSPPISKNAQEQAKRKYPNKLFANTVYMPPQELLLESQ